MKNLELSGTALLETRALLIKVLSAGFHYPDPAWSDRYEYLLSEIGETAGPIKSAWRVASLDDLQAEHFRLFGPSALCPLEIAFHISENPFQQVAIMSQLAGVYRIFGVDSLDGLRPDHLSICLEFLSYLYLKKANAVKRGLFEAEAITDTGIRLYLHDYLRPALESFSRKLLACSANGFYRDLAEQTWLQVAKDGKQWLPEVTEEELPCEP